jgi:hypothetical protein
MSGRWLKDDVLHEMPSIPIATGMSGLACEGDNDAHVQCPAPAGDGLLTVHPVATLGGHAAWGDRTRTSNLVCGSP